MSINDVSKNRFIFAGDWHGSYAQAESVVNFASDYNMDTIVHVGDFGIWHGDKKYLNKLDYLLENRDCRLFFIDGNHENFDMLFAKKFNEDGTRYVRDRISYLPRGFRWNWDGVSFLAIGGARSIDVNHRVPGKSWWPQEVISDDDIALCAEGGPVDVMVSHDSPASAPNSVTDSSYDQLEAMRMFGIESVRSCTDHRKQLQRVSDIVVPKLIIHGHYHRRMEGYFKHEDENNSVGYVIGLDQGLGSIVNHTFTFSFDQFRQKLDNISRMV